MGLTPHVQATGGRGVHVVAALDGSADFDQIRSIAQDLADRFVARDPDRLTTAARKERRGGRVYLDVNRNAYDQAFLAPYSLRARPGAPVATPLEWSELGRVAPTATVRPGSAGAWPARSIPGPASATTPPRPPMCAGDSTRCGSSPARAGARPADERRPVNGGLDRTRAVGYSAGGQGSMVSPLMRPSRSVNRNRRSTMPPGKSPSSRWVAV
ncbi:hypothetical protein BJF90_35590 [Pseudonocardia sp. CNS-004]|nr:hypothetical protein BJF90_35590 [Pseudonocardia sp. CNS-004]